MLIELRGTEFTRGINLFHGLGRFDRGLGLISFRTTGAKQGRIKTTYFKCVAIKKGKRRMKTTDHPSRRIRTKIQLQDAIHKIIQLKLQTTPQTKSH